MPLPELEDTFGGRAGWTVAHPSRDSTLQHQLLAYRTAQRPALYAEMVGTW